MKKLKKLSLMMALVMLFCTCFGVLANAANVSSYTDVSTSAWYYDEVKYAVEKGFVDGVSSTSFAPTATMTRAQFILGLARMMGGSGTNTGKFTDVSASANYASAVYWGVENGIIQGSSDTTFSPNDRLTRQDMATMIGRMINKMNLNVPEVSNPVAVFTDMDKVRSYAKDSVDLLRRCGLLKGYSNGLVGPLDTMTRAEGTAIIVRMDKILHGESNIPLIDPNSGSGSGSGTGTGTTPSTTVTETKPSGHEHTYELTKFTTVGSFYDGLYKRTYTCQTCGKSYDDTIQTTTKETANGVYATYLKADGTLGEIVISSDTEYTMENMKKFATALGWTENPNCTMANCNGYTEVITAYDYKNACLNFLESSNLLRYHILSFIEVKETGVEFIQRTSSVKMYLCILR